MKRFICVLLVFSILLCMVGCSSGVSQEEHDALLAKMDELQEKYDALSSGNADSADDAKEETTDTAPENAESDASEKANTPEENKTEEPEPEPEPEPENKEPIVDNSSVTITEQVLVDQDGIKITAKEYIHDPAWNDSVKLLIENNTDVNIRVRCENLIVNNYMFGDYFSELVTPGKKVNAELDISSSDLENACIEKIGQIEIYFVVTNDETYDTILTSDVCTIKTSEYDNMVIQPNDEGIELYNENGIRIVGKCLNEHGFFGESILLFVENNTVEKIRVSCENMSINGFMVDGYLYCNVFPGRMAVDFIIISSTDLEDNGIESIEEIDLSFRIINADTYNLIVETDTISLVTVD